MESRLSGVDSLRGGQHITRGEEYYSIRLICHSDTLIGSGWLLHMLEGRHHSPNATEKVSEPTGKERRAEDLLHGWRNSGEG